MLIGIFGIGRYKRGAGRENRTLLSALGRLHNSHYTIPADMCVLRLWSHLGDSNPRPPLYESGALAN